MRRLGITLKRYNSPAGRREFVAVSIYNYCRTMKAPGKGVFHWHLQRLCKNRHYFYKNGCCVCPNTCCNPPH